MEKKASKIVALYVPFNEADSPLVVGIKIAEGLKALVIGTPLLKGASEEQAKKEFARWLKSAQPTAKFKIVKFRRVE